MRLGVGPRGSPGAVKPVTTDATKDGGRVTKVAHPAPLQVALVVAMASPTPAPSSFMVRVDRSLRVIRPRFIVAITAPPVLIPVARPQPPVMKTVRDGRLGRP